ncbi:MAG: hypothetical protein HYS62_01105 [Candidatus Aenigmarchaeota archaeon]|nr:hypothetical protein [Candidatus Aenigmarchaeota archaeon]
MRSLEPRLYEADLSLGKMREYIENHPLDASWKSGLTPGVAMGYVNTVSPYTLTATSALANIGIVASGALFAGLLTLGAGWFLYNAFLRGKRKYRNGQQNPQYKGEPRGWLKGALDWTTEMNAEAAQSVARVAPRG